MKLTDEMKAAILAEARESQADGYAMYADDPEGTARVEQITQMLYDLNVRSFEAGFHDTLMAIVWQNGHDSGEEFGMSWSYWAEHNGGAEPVREENPYGI